MCSIKDVDREKAGVGGNSREASTCSTQRTSDQVRPLSTESKRQIHTIGEA